MKCRALKTLQNRLPIEANISLDCNDKGTEATFATIN